MWCIYYMSIHLAFCLIKSTKFKVFRRNFRTKIIENPVVMRFVGFCPIITRASIRRTMPVAFIYENLLFTFVGANCVRPRAAKRLPYTKFQFAMLVFVFCGDLYCKIHFGMKYAAAVIKANKEKMLTVHSLLFFFFVI